MASMLTNRGRMMILDGSLSLLNHTLKAMLLNNAYVPNKDHAYISDIAAEEISGTGYVAGYGGSGRKALSSKAVGKNDTTDYAYFDCADITWTAINAGTVAHVAIVREVTSNADSPILGVIELPTFTETNGADWTWLIPASGVFVW